jgi:hypothetical protein
MFTASQNNSRLLLLLALRRLIPCCQLVLGLHTVSTSTIGSRIPAFEPKCEKNMGRIRHLSFYSIGNGTYGIDNRFIKVLLQLCPYGLFALFSNAQVPIIRQVGRIQNKFDRSTFFRRRATAISLLLRVSYSLLQVTSQPIRLNEFGRFR